ncbi:MAG: hypothetical protein KJ804_22490 [Proteobacteria bacterium]|nr:hypothetical protein [Pseudomonadota bacterium]
MSQSDRLFTRGVCRNTVMNRNQGLGLSATLGERPVQDQREDTTATPITFPG